jgi:hypothetical protein
MGEAGDMSDHDPEPPHTAGPDGGRDFIRKAAVVGTGAFLVPMTITVDRADAHVLTSPRPQPPGEPEPTLDTADRRRARAAGTPVTGRSGLPRTGADLDRLAVAGLAATAGGAALKLWSADSKPTT